MSFKSVKIKYIASLNPSKSELQIKQDISLDVSFLPMEKIIGPNQLDLSIKKNINDVYSGYTYFSENDIILAKVTPCFENGNIAVARGLVNKIGFGTTELHVLRVNSRYYSVDYVYYCLQNEVFKSEAVSSMYGVGGLKRIPSEFLREYRISIPSLKDQKKISAFLNFKLNEIDNIVKNKKLLINKLEQQRQSIITEAVTKGLNPNVKMKDSGVEWIGAIPEHWELKALKYSFKIGNGKEIENELAFDDLSGVNVYGSGGVFKKTDNVLFDGESVLFGRKGTIGKPMYVNESFWTVDTMYYTKYNPESYAKWFYYLLTVYPWSTITTHTALPSVVGSDIANSVCGIPSYREQIEIATYLSEKDEEVNSLIIIIKQSIDKLKEYRQSLIYEAVTGKIDVSEMELEEVR